MAPSGALASANISGTWNCCGEGGAAAQDFQITDSGGSLSGHGLEPGGSSFAVITGSVSGSSVTIVTTYEASFDAGYVATFTGTVAASGTSMSGSWQSNAGQSGTWTATLSGSPATPEPEPSKEPTKKRKKAASFTAVSCYISVTAPNTSTCTAQVAGYGAAQLVSPTGAVTFTATHGTIGSGCTLQPTAGSPGISSCTVSYLPAPGLAAGVLPGVRAHYSGDSNYPGSSGETSLTPQSVAIDGGEGIDQAAPEPDGASSEGIPVDLTNTNAFAVSADAQLTVSGYPQVANTSSVAPLALTARTQVIGRAAYRLAPLQTLAAKVKLSRGALKLLKRRKKLNAVLVITTKGKGRTRTVRQKLVITEP
jgi:hypothetical protein